MYSSELKDAKSDINNGNQKNNDMECFDVLSADDESNNEDASAMVDEAKNTNIMKHFAEFLKSLTVSELLENVISASAAFECLGGNERGSTSRHRKVKSLLARWIEYDTKARANNGVTNEEQNNGGTENSNVFNIERGTVVTSIISRGKTKISKQFIVLGVYDKYYNKWFMTAEEKRWGPSVSVTEKKKYKVAIRMVEDGVLEKYDYVSPYDVGYNRKEVFRMVDGAAIIEVKGKFISE